MENKNKVRLSPEQETLLITMYSKGNPDNPFIEDPKAREILRQIDYDFSGLQVPWGTYSTVSMRAKKMDNDTLDFIQKHPHGLVIHLACGLDSRYDRLGKPPITWIDLDFPSVIKLRRNFYDETEYYQMLASSVTDLEWVNSILKTDQPVLILAEGLFMYLKEEEVKSLLKKLSEHFKQFNIIFDAFSELTARKVKDHPSIQQTGATIHWGIDDPWQMENWIEGLQFTDQWFFKDCIDIRKLSFTYRLIFKISGWFKIARNAHRVLYFTYQ
ncbi:MAG: class I SAM-dependent methyltransferase [Anaerolineaceae bacterium]|nr:class I SAM-dependent methyltransferase [Anaerolineaceae bacterium]